MRSNSLASTALAAALVALMSGYAYAAETPAPAATTVQPQAPAQAGGSNATAGPEENQEPGEAEEENGGYGPGMMGGGYGPGMMGAYGGGMMGYGPGMMGGYGRGMMGYGPGMMGGGYGPGMMDYGPGMMRGYGPWMMGRGMGPGAWSGCGYWAAHHPWHRRAALNLSPQDVKNRLEQWLEWRGNPHIKVGEVKEKDSNTITADIVTQDNSLVQRYDINRHTGMFYPAEH